MTAQKVPPMIHPEDEELVSQLASLQAMHDQIYHLRTLPQALVNPVSETLRIRTAPSNGLDVPSKLYNKVQKIAIAGLKDVESFKQDWLSDESQTLWKRTLNEPCPQGSDVWRVDYIASLEQSKAHEQDRAAEIDISATNTRDIKDIIQDFREKHPTAKLESQDSADGLPFNVRIAGMTFQVTSSAHRSERKYEVQYNQGSIATQLQDGVLQHLSERRVKGNLEYLLNMMAAYEDVKRRPCEKCLKIFDKRLTFPVIRNQKSRTVPNGETDAQWEALHKHCT